MKAALPMVADHCVRCVFCLVPTAHFIRLEHATWRPKNNGLKVQQAAPHALTLRGQTIHLYCAMKPDKKNASTTVPMKPPMKPSQVFFGESLIRGVRPKKNPACKDSGKIHEAKQV